MNISLEFAVPKTPHAETNRSGRNKLRLAAPFHALKSGPKRRNRCAATFSCRPSSGRLDVHFLAIESSCDETSVAIFTDDLRILANVVASQIELHARFGGVVPEVA